MSNTFKVVVAGSRDFNDYSFLKRKLDKLLETQTKPIEIVSGGARGADKLGESYSWDVLGKKPTVFQAKWKDIAGKPKHLIKENKYGKYYTLAGVERNHAMGDYANALVAFRVNKSRGTTDMIEYSKQKGLQVRVYDV